VTEQTKVVKLRLKQLLEEGVTLEEGWRVVSTVAAPHTLPAFAGNVKNGDVFVLIARTAA
jgi:hypothetical protein